MVELWEVCAIISSLAEGNRRTSTVAFITRLPKTNLKGENMPFKIGWPELILVLVIVLLVFGVGRLGRLGKDLGEGISSFRQGLKGDQEEEDTEEAAEEE